MDDSRPAAERFPCIEEMLNNVEIKKFPSKERMAQISEKWKILPQEQKDM